MNFAMFPTPNYYDPPSFQTSYSDAGFCARDSKQNSPRLQQSPRYPYAASSSPRHPVSPNAGHPFSPTPRNRCPTNPLFDYYLPKPQPQETERSSNAWVWRNILIVKYRSPNRFG